MRHLIILTFLFTLMASTNAYSQDDKISHYEKFVIKGDNPFEEGVETRYENDYRVLVWRDELSMDYIFNNEAFNKLGYEYINTNKGDQYQTSKVYRNCEKGIVCTVTKWYGMYFSISMSWFEANIRRSIGDLMFCP